MPYTFNTAQLAAAILNTYGHRGEWVSLLNRESPKYNNALWCTIKLISDGNLRQAEHKMSSRIGRKAAKAYKQAKELQAIGQ